MARAAGASQESLQRFRTLMLKIFLAALVLRWGYALALYYFMGESGLKGVDSVGYLMLSEQFTAAIRAGGISGTQWLGQAPYIMPLYQWLMALPILMFGQYGAIAYVFLQGFLDSATCVLVYAIARSFSDRIAFLAALAAIFNPTQIVLSGLVYNDTPFTFFMAFTFYASLRWVTRPTWSNAIILGCTLGCAGLIRVSVAPWAFFAIVLLVGYSAWKRTDTKKLLSIAAAAAILSVSLGSIAIRNFNQYGAFSLTPQGGDYLTLWIIPLAKEAQDRTPFLASQEKILAQMVERFGPHSDNPFEQSRRYQEIGREILRSEIKLTSLMTSWASGMFINLLSPAHLLSPPVALLPRTGFYGTPGNSFVEKAYNYAFHSGSAIYSWLLIVGGCGLAAFRAIQLLGLWTLAKERSNWPSIIFAGSWIGFLLLVNGPIASPKYRLPLEPLFNIAAGAGLASIRNIRACKQRNG